MKNKDLVIYKKNSLSEIPFSLRDISTETKKTYSAALKVYERFLKTSGDSPGLDSLTKWIESIREPRTQHIYLAAARKVLSEVYGKDPRYPELYRQLAQIKSVKIDQAVKEGDFLIESEIKALVKGAPVKIGIMIEALFWSGCRISELLSIRLEKCREEAGGVIAIDIVGKGRKQGTVYLKKKVYDRARVVFRGREYLFEHHGKQYNRNYPSLQIKKLSADILDKNISAHTLRHSKAMYLKDVKKMSADLVAKAMRHTDVATTLKYYFHGIPTAKDQGI